MKSRHRSLGLIGLGTMGGNLALNIADHGFALSLYTRDPLASERFCREHTAQAKHFHACKTIDEFISSLQPPRQILLLITAGQAIDDMLLQLLPKLAADDTVLDGGNSNFHDTDRRIRTCREYGVDYLGLGISGGAAGARTGPSIMAGGTRNAYARAENWLEAVAAKSNGTSCAAYLGSGSCGHYVKMVHNAIEYSLMQGLAESYDQLRRAHGLDAPTIGRLYRSWLPDSFGGFLLEVSATVLLQADDWGDGFLIDQIVDAAEQKGTGLWNMEAAASLSAAVPSLDAAVAARNLSALYEQRQQAAAIYGQTDLFATADPAALTAALDANLLLSFAQGFSQLRRASTAYNYELSLADIAAVWREGCIIRTPLLERIRLIFQDSPNLDNLLLSPQYAELLTPRLPALRQTAAAACLAGLPAPVFTASLAYFDAFRSPRLPANLLQAQRDCFGNHGYRRIDRPGTFHSAWQNEEEGGG